MEGFIFGIQRLSLHDGPGIRTTVFLKGCPLVCKWCCNPESLEMKEQLAYDSTKCKDSLECVSVCKRGATVHFSGTTGLAVQLAPTVAIGPTFAATMPLNSMYSVNRLL